MTSAVSSTATNRSRSQPPGAATTSGLTGVTRSTGSASKLIAPSTSKSAAAASRQQRAGTTRSTSADDGGTRVQSGAVPGRPSGKGGATAMGGGADICGRSATPQICVTVAAEIHEPPASSAATVQHRRSQSAAVGTSQLQSRRGTSGLQPQHQQSRSAVGVASTQKQQQGVSRQPQQPQPQPQSSVGDDASYCRLQSGVESEIYDGGSYSFSTAVVSGGGIRTPTVGRASAAATAAADRPQLPRLSASSSTGSASKTEKTEEELEKMRILARHIKIYTDWSNHYLEKINSSYVVTDLQTDISSGLVLAELIYAVTNESVPDINRSPENNQQMVNIIQKCLAFLAQLGANVDGIEAKNIRAGSLKSILGLLFNLSCYKHQQLRQQQQQQQQIDQQGNNGGSTFSGGGGPSPAGRTRQHQSPLGPPALPPTSSSCGSGHSTAAAPPQRLPGPGPATSWDASAAGGRSTSYEPKAISRLTSPSDRSQPQCRSQLQSPSTRSSSAVGSADSSRKLSRSNAATPSQSSGVRSSSENRPKQPAGSSSSSAAQTGGEPPKSPAVEPTSSTGKATSMLNRFKLFNSKDAKSTRTGRDVAAPVAGGGGAPADRHAAVASPPPTLPQSSSRDTAAASCNGLYNRNQQQSQPAYCPSLPNGSSHISPYAPPHPGLQYPPQQQHQQQQQQNGHAAMCGQNGGPAELHNGVRQLQRPSVHGPPFTGEHHLPQQQQQQQQQQHRMLPQVGHHPAPAPPPPQQQHQQHMSHDGSGLHPPSRLACNPRSTSAPDSHQRVLHATVAQQQQQQQQQQMRGPTSSSSSRRPNDVDPSAAAGCRSPSSSMQSRTASSTSISSIASSSTMGGGGGASGTAARRSGLARRVSSNSAQQDRRVAKSATAGAASGVSASGRMAKSAGKPSSASAAGSASSSTTGSALPVPGNGTLSRLPSAGIDFAGGTARRQQKVSSASGHNSETSDVGKDLRRMPGTGGSSAADMSKSPAANNARQLPRAQSSGRPVEDQSSAVVATTPENDSSRSSASDANTAGRSKLSRMQQPGSATGSSRTVAPAPSTAKATSQRTSTDGLEAADRRRPTDDDGSMPDGSRLSVAAAAATGGRVRNVATSNPAASSAVVVRPIKEKSSSSISSGFGDESNNSTSDSTDSVIFQPSGGRPSAARDSSAVASMIGCSSMESSSSAVESDAAPMDASTCDQQLQSSTTPPCRQPTLDHISSLRIGGTRQQQRASGNSAVTVDALSSPSNRSNPITSSPNLSAGSSDSRSDVEVFDIQPMQPLVRSTVPCCVYQPSTRRLPTLLSQSSLAGSGPGGSGLSASRRLVFSRPPLISASRLNVTRAGGVVGCPSTAGDGVDSAVASGYMSDGDILRSTTVGARSGTERTASGYTSEGGGVSVYARRMQQRFLEGLMSVRQSMERNTLTDDDSFDECSSLSSDDGAVDASLLDGPSNVDAALEESDGRRSSQRPVATPGRNGVAASVSGHVTRPASGNGVRGGVPTTAGSNGGGFEERVNCGERMLGGGWKKYYIDPVDVLQSRGAGPAAAGGPFERGSSQRVTLPLAGGSAITPQASGLLVKRSQQAVVTDLRQRSARGQPAELDCVDEQQQRRQKKDSEANTERGVGGVAEIGRVPPPMSVRSASASGGRSSRSAAAAAAENQTGERLSNYRRSTIHRPGSATGSISADEEAHGSKLSPDADPSARRISVGMCASPEDGRRSRADNIDRQPYGSRCSLTDWSPTGGAIVQDGGQGPAPSPAFYPPNASRTSSGFHDYVNVSYLVAKAAASGSLTRPTSGMSSASTGSGSRSPWIRAGGGRMAMSETESIENLAGWPTYGAGSGPAFRRPGGATGGSIQRSDSFRSAAGGSCGGPIVSTSASLPRAGSAVQVWSHDGSQVGCGGAGHGLASFRLGAAGVPYGVRGQGPQPSNIYSIPLKSRLSASKDDNLHCSSLSIGSNSSAYSTAEDQQAQEIRRLRHELEAAQAKIMTLSTQLSTNAHVVSAFEQSLANMTHRLQQLAANTDQKEAELNELRATIEILRQQGHIQFSPMRRPPLLTSTPFKDSATNGTDPQQIRRHVSSDSVASMCSGGSHQSSNVDNGADKKKKPKTWLKIPFGKAFSRKKKCSTSDAESDTSSLYSDVSLAQSAQAQLSGALSVPTTPIKCSRSDMMLMGSSPGQEESVSELQQQLHEKDMKLTDIRLEALSSAHQLEQLRDTMNRMKNEMMSLKHDNERLQYLIQQKGINPAAILAHNDMPADHRLSLDDPANLDLLLADAGSRGAQRITLSIRLSPTNIDAKVNELQLTEILIGIMSVTNSTTWDQLTETVRKNFKDYLIRLDPSTSLGLNGDSINNMNIGEILYAASTPAPELLPCGYLVGDNTNIAVSLKGATEKSVDALAFETLIPKSIVQRYVSLLVEHRRIILCGPSGTGKTFLAQRLAEYLVLRGGDSLCPGSIATFSVDHKSGRELRQYLASVADQCEQKSSELPCVIILDSLHHVTSLSEVFNGFLSVHYQSSPYIIGTMNQTTSTCSPTNLQLHHNFRWVLCANHMEPVHGFLARYLHQRLVDAQIREGGALGGAAGSGGTGADEECDMEKVVDWIPRVWQHLNKFLETHSSSDVTVGPRLFLSCPMDPGAVQVWFNDLWNYSIVPYLLEAIKEGVQTYGSRVPWEDPSDWVIKTYPWSNQAEASEGTTASPLLRLRPEDVGYDNQAATTSSSSSAATSQKTMPASAANDAESSDPLLNMLMRLQEAAGINGSSHTDSAVDDSNRYTVDE